MKIRVKKDQRTKELRRNQRRMEDLDRDERSVQTGG